MFKILKAGFVVFLAVVVLVTGSPAMAQTSDLLASAERAALTMAVEQDQELEQEDQSVVRRRRSGGLAWAGGILAVAGAVLALRPPVCGLQGGRVGERETWSRLNDSFNDAVRTTEYSHELIRGSCAVRRHVTDRYYTYPDSSTVTRQQTFSIYDADENSGWDYEGRVATTDKTWNYVGWASIAAGGALLGLGLSGVDVPVRLDVAPTGGFRVARSLGW